MGSDNAKKKGRKRKNATAAEGNASGGGTGSPASTPINIGRPRKKGKTATSGGSNATKANKEKREKSGGSVKEKGKAPVDVEKQCGVALPQGGYCARSLTCKTHSMGAKRAVPGRSQPYDVLLAAYQKRNQVKQASLSTQQQLEMDNEALLLEGDAALNPEEEFEQVMAGVVKAYPVPLERKVVMPAKLRTKFFRMREMLIGSLTNVPPVPSSAAASTVTSSTNGAAVSSASQQSVNAVMSATGSLLGRTIVFDTTTGAQYARPPRVYVNTNQQQQQVQQQVLLQRQRQLQLAGLQQAQNASGQPPTQQHLALQQALQQQSRATGQQQPLGTQVR